MSEDSPVLNRGLFGYRRSTVNQIISDRDLMLRQAEGRVRASQAKIADLEAQLAALRGQNSRREQELRTLDEAGTPIEAEALATEGSDALDAGSGSGEPDEPEIVDVEAFEVEPLSEPEAPVEAEPLLEAEPMMEPEPVSEPPMAEAPAAPASSGSPGMSTSKFVGDEIARIMSAAEEAAARIMERAQLFTQGQVAEANRLWREVQEELATFRAWREEITPQIEAVQTKVEEVRGRIDDVPERIREALAPMADSIASIDGDLAGLLAAASPPDLIAPSDLDIGASSQWTDRPDEAVSMLQESPNGDGGSEDHS